MKLIKTIKTVSNIIYVYKKENDLLAFKPSKDIKKEILANKLAKLFNIKTLKIKPIKINDKEGILMPYLKDNILLMHYKKKLNKEQINQLKRIILFDIWVGNQDRHTANILINHSLIIFDHENIFQKGNARKFIKLDLGRKLNKNYVGIIENLLYKDLTALQALKKFGFIEQDFVDIKDKDIKEIVKDKNLVKFLISRKNLNCIKF